MKILNLSLTLNITICKKMKVLCIPLSFEIMVCRKKKCIAFPIIVNNYGFLKKWSIIVGTSDLDGCIMLVMRNFSNLAMHGLWGMQHQTYLRGGFKEL